MRQAVLILLVISCGLMATTSQARSHRQVAGAKKCRAHAGKCRKKRAPVTTPSAAPATTSGDPVQPATPAPATTPAPSDPATSEYVALGDSLAAGWSASEGYDYVSLLFANFRKNFGVTELSNRAVPGETSSSLLGSQLTGALSDINGPSDTKVVTLDIGLNDYFAENCTFRSDPCTATFEANFSSALSQIRTALDGDPGAEALIVLDYFNPFAGEGTANEWATNTILLGDSMTLGCSDSGDELGLDDAIAQVAPHYGALFAETYLPFEAQGQAFMDQSTVHPNDAGHRAIADSVLGATALCG